MIVDNPAVYAPQHAHHEHLTSGDPGPPMTRARPTIGVVVEPGSSMPPGLDPLLASHEVHLVDDPSSMHAALDACVEVLGVWDLHTPLVRDSWARAGCVRWIHASSAGVDAVLFPEVRAARVTVTNARGVFDRGMAEFVLMAILVFAKDLLTTVALQRAHEWRHRDTEPVEGRTLTVVGAGSIGREVARLAGTAGMRVLGVARRARPDDPDFEEVAAADELHRLLAPADYVAVTAPLTTETEGMIDAEAFAAMKPGARLINVGRGPVVDEEALLEALERGQLAGAALDVFATEPLPGDHPFWDRPDVLVSPHMSGDLEGWRVTLGELFVDNVQRWTRGEPLRNVVFGPDPGPDDTSGEAHGRASSGHASPTRQDPTRP